ncbi:MAG: hypothetical protein R3Y28_01615 [Candidatus Gastranaerophilales bacterium]
MNEEQQEEDSDRCEHLFMPVDSTKEHLACSKCGLIVHKDNLKKYNIFKKKFFK